MGEITSGVANIHPESPASLSLRYRPSIEGGCISSNWRAHADELASMFGRRIVGQWTACEEPDAVVLAHIARKKRYWQDKLEQTRLLNTGDRQARWMHAATASLDALERLEAAIGI